MYCQYFRVDAAARPATHETGLLLRRVSSILDKMNGYRALRVGQILLKVGGVVVGLVFALIATFRDLSTASDSPTPDDDTMGDVFRGGDLNFRTGKFDDGTDPAGWYEND
jgi:hypothetical protein